MENKRPVTKKKKNLKTIASTKLNQSNGLRTDRSYELNQNRKAKKGSLFNENDLTAS